MVNVIDIFFFFMHRRIRVVQTQNFELIKDIFSNKLLSCYNLYILKHMFGGFILEKTQKYT